MKTNRKGSGNYSDIKWLAIELPEPFRGYTHVHLTPYRITADEIRMLQDSECVRGEETPDIDKSSGNIHPSRKKVAEANAKDVFQQAVLVRKKSTSAPTGPILANGELYDGTLYTFGKASVPAANYYPLIEPIEKLTEEERKKQALLAEILYRYR